MIKASMENQSNLQQPILSHPNPSETEITPEPATSPSGTPEIPKNPVNTADNAIMGKCLSVCKEPKNPLGQSESPDDARPPSRDRNDPPKLLATTSRSLAHMHRTNNAIGGGVQALTDDAKHAGHIGLTFISLSPINHQRMEQREQSPNLEAEKGQESKHEESERQENVVPAPCGSETAGRKQEGTDENHHQQASHPSPGDARSNILPEHPSEEEVISPQSVTNNHGSSDGNLHSARTHENQNHHQPSPNQSHPENENVRDLQNAEDMHVTEQLVPARIGLSSRWTPFPSNPHREQEFRPDRMPESVRERKAAFRGLRRLFEISRPHSQNIGIASRDEVVTEIDILSPGALDGPPMQPTISLIPQYPKSFTELSKPAILALRLSRLQSCKGFDLDGFLHVFVKNAPVLKELAFEDAGQISKRTARIFADIKCLERLEVYDPKVPLLRAFTIGRSELKELCLHGLTTEVERDLCLFLRHKGASLYSLSLNFNLSARKTEWTTEQKKFFNRMLMFLQGAMAEVLSDLFILEVSSCPSYEVKHSFDAIGSTSRTEQLAIYQVDTMLRENQRVLHPKASMISLRKIKLRGHFTAIKETLEVLSWVNQDKMEIELELPGVSAFYPRGFGIMKPVVLTFLQLDKFISQALMLPWLELTALREIDLGEIEFVRKYNADTESVRTDTRKLLVTSRESLSRVRVCYKIPTRDICLETRKFLGHIVPLTPLVTHLDISRDIVLHASVGDYEYMETILLLRDWNLKTVQLVSSQNYGKIETVNNEAESDAAVSVKKDKTEEFIRKLPAFLTILAAACPNLENLLVESVETSGGWKECKERTRLLEDAMKALEVFESVVPTVKVGTLRGQLNVWEAVPNTEE